MAKQTTEKNKKRKLWQYVLYACFLICGSVLIVILPATMKQSGGFLTIKALNDLCETYDVKMDVFRLGLTRHLNHYVMESDTPAGEVEAFIFSVSSEDSSPDKLQLSSEENPDFEFLAGEILDEYSPKLFRQLHLPPHTPYRWRLIEKPSGERLAIWYQEENENLPDRYSEQVGNIYMISW